MWRRWRWRWWWWWSCSGGRRGRAPSSSPFGSELGLSSLHRCSLVLSTAAPHTCRSAGSDSAFPAIAANARSAGNPLFPTDLASARRQRTRETPTGEVEEEEARWRRKGRGGGGGEGEGGGGSGGGAGAGGETAARRRRCRWHGMPIRGECHRVRCHRCECWIHGKPIVSYGSGLQAKAADVANTPGEVEEE